MKEETMQTAVLTKKDGTTIEVQVPAFPDNPELVIHDTGFYAASWPVIGYGTDTLAYHEVEAYSA